MAMTSNLTCPLLNTIGHIFFLIFAASLVLNLYLLFLLTNENKSKRKPMNTLIIFNSIVNLVGTLIHLPFIIASHYSCRWIWNEIGCIFAGYTMYGAGCISIYIMVTISLIRYYAVVQPENAECFSQQRVNLGILFSVFLGLFWPTAPIFGWSNYELESSKTVCIVASKNSNLSILSYNISMFVFVYFIPLFIILYTNISLTKTVIHRPLLEHSKKKKANLEAKLTFATLIYTFIFIFAWSPYALVFFLETFILTTGTINPMLHISCAVFAKSSMIWSSAYFIYFNLKMKKRDRVYKKKLSSARLSLHSHKSRAMSDHAGAVHSIKHFSSTSF